MVAVLIDTCEKKGGFHQHRHKEAAGVPRVSSKVLLRNRLTLAKANRLGDAKRAALLSASNTCWDTAVAKDVVRSKVKSASVTGSAWMVAASKRTARPSGPTPKLLASMSDWVRTTSSFARETLVIGIPGRRIWLTACGLGVSGAGMRCAREEKG